MRAEAILGGNAGGHERLLLTTPKGLKTRKILTAQRACCYYSSDFLSMQGYILAVIWGLL